MRTKGGTINVHIEKLDRYRGAMVGTLCGDALGAPYEWKSPKEIRPILEEHGGLKPFEYKPFDYIDPWKKKDIILKGHPTDDSELAAALAMSLVSNPKFDPADLYRRLRGFIHERKSILAKVAYGTGGTLRAALKPETYEESAAKFAVGEMPTPPSNGSLMRCIAVPLSAFPDPMWAMKLAEKQSVVTHKNSSCMAACVAYSTLVCFVLWGTKPREAWTYTVKTLGTHPRWKDDAAMQEVLSIKLAKPDYASEMKGKEGWAVLSLRVALWASITAQDFADGILSSILVGGDTDTYGAIAGGILGAHFGLSGIPQDWVSVLQGKDIMLNLAYQLAR